MDLLDEFQTHVLCGDGAMGTLLLTAGVWLRAMFEELCVTEPNRSRRSIASMLPLALG